MSELSGLFLTTVVAAFVASLHCVGMCGGFAALAGRGSSTGILALSQAAYHVGKTTTYLFLGAIAALAGGRFAAYAPFKSGQLLLSLVAGLFLIAVGLQMAGLWPRLVLAGRLSAAMASGFVALERIGGIHGSLLLGVFNGLLPCPLVYAFVAQAAAIGDPLSGMAVMAGLGVSTIPALSLASGIGQLLTASRRLVMIRVAGLLLVVFGVITLARGFVPHDHSSHADHSPEAQAVHHH